MGLAAKDRRIDADNIYMKQVSKDHIGDTVRIRRPPKVFTDYLGRTVWMSGVEPVQLEVEPDLDCTNPYELNNGKLSNLSTS